MNLLLIYPHSPLPAHQSNYADVFNTCYFHSCACILRHITGLEPHTSLHLSLYQHSLEGHLFLLPVAQHPTVHTSRSTAFSQRPVPLCTGLQRCHCLLGPQWTRWDTSRGSTPRSGKCWSSFQPACPPAGRQDSCSPRAPPILSISHLSNSCQSSKRCLI